MNKLNVFLSYCSEEEKSLAGKLKEMFKSYCGYEVFLAHDDMIPSTDFKEGIIKGIKNCDVFIALISKTYKTSEFTDQETRMAVPLKKKIIPVKIDHTNPYGFLSDYHALKLRNSSSEAIQQIVSEIGILGLRHFTRILHEKAKNSIVFALKQSGQFKTSNVIIPILCECPSFNSEQLKTIKEAASTNYEVQGAFALGLLERALKNKYK